MTNKIARIKYPRTPHLPWSLGISGDDRVICSLNSFRGREIICTEKRDGECTSLYPDGTTHARSTDSSTQPWQSWVKKFWRERCYNLPENWRVCGENLYAQHSISYELETYFEGFSIWDNDICLSWKDTLEWFELLDIKPVPVLYQGIYSEGVFNQLAREIDITRCEGYVVRVADRIKYRDFGISVAKFVRLGHGQTDGDWAKSWKPNYQKGAPPLI